MPSSGLRGRAMQIKSTFFQHTRERERENFFKVYTEAAPILVKKKKVSFLSVKNYNFIFNIKNNIEE